jgi:NAD(P)-dependent dehydrogenase (short-subunit alcohol dehydrogenase family)
MTDRQSVVVAGVGPGLGIAVSRRFASEGYGVTMLARDGAKLASYAAEEPKRLNAFSCDLTDPASVTAAVEEAERFGGPLACAVFNAGAFEPGSLLDIDPSDFERCWRVGTFGGFLIGQAAARKMVPRGLGTILFTGATASLRGSANFANLASPKFALRALAQSMARELGPRGVHVAHVIIDGQIRTSRSEVFADEGRPDSRLQPEAIAETYMHLHRQSRSAWSHEIDLRPWAERF